MKKDLWTYATMNKWCWNFHKKMKFRLFCVLFLMTVFQKKRHCEIQVDNSSQKDTEAIDFTFIKLRHNVTQRVDKQKRKHESKQCHAGAIHHSTAIDRQGFYFDVSLVFALWIWCRRCKRACYNTTSFGNFFCLVGFFTLYSFSLNHSAVFHYLFLYLMFLLLSNKLCDGFWVGLKGIIPFFSRSI